MALPDHFIEELTLKNSIEDLVSSYVSLRPRGKTRVGLCPFHGEKTPSFTVYPDNNSFYCFGCGAGGDIITFVKKIEHLDYIDAVKFLAERAGMEMPRMSGADDTASKIRRRILEANREAAHFFHEMLYSEKGQQALAYCHGRQYSDRTIRRFGMGYALDDFHALRDHLRARGFRDDELLLSGLVKRSAKGYLYDNFRNRVIVPIIDVRGNILGFGGRVLDDSKPKYINTEDTPVFKKTHNLFALNMAKESGRKLILCEGYMDVIALNQAGFPFAVATMGTALTADHANLISRYADEVILLFDSDEAGQKAASRAMSVLRNTGLRIRVMRIPDGKDPDEFLRKHAPEAFKLLMDRAANDIEYRLSTLKQGYLTETADGKVAYLQEAVKLLSDLHNPVERDVYAARLSQELSVSKSAILQQIEQVAKRKTKKLMKQQFSQELRRTEAITSKVNPEALKAVRAAAAEEALIGALLLHPDRVQKVSAMLPVEDMITPFNRKVYGAIVERHKNGQLIELSLLSASFGEDEMAYLTYLCQASQNRSETVADLIQYVEIIRAEKAFASMSDVSELSDDEMRKMMEKLREIKK